MAKERSTYFPLHECREDELAQLRDAVYYGTDDIPPHWDTYDYPADIPMEVLAKYFDGISFVEEDFFCNCKEVAA